ncbi:MAG: hypothetical protein LLG01_14150 [Planctomycetaceae bacterium]|nr:hypothetical protein [Planctomycetaceae bacterium]
MKRAVVEKLVCIVLPAVLMFWTACLCVLWGWAFDTSGGSALMILAATLLALGAAIQGPFAMGRWLQRLLERRGRGKAVRAFVQQRVSSGAAGHAAAATVIAASAALALLGGVLSTLAIYGGAVLAYRLCAGMLWTPLGWTAVKLAIACAGMLPMGLGMAVTLGAGRLVRCETPGACFGGLMGDWVVALAAAIVTFGALFILGVNILGMAALAALSALLATVALFQQRQADGSARHIIVPAPLSRRLRLGAALVAGAVVAGMLVQLRFLEDLLGLGTGEQALAAAGLLGLLAMGLWCSRRRRDEIGPAEELAAGAGAAAILIIQATLMVASALLDEAMWVCGLTAVALQLPLSMLTACVLTARQRNFMRCGGRVEQLAGPVAAGGGAGVLSYSLAASLPSGGWVLIAAVATACIAWLIAAAMRRKLIAVGAWAFWLPVLLAAAAAGFDCAASGMRGRGGPVTVGVWLTSLSTYEGGQDVSYLPTGKTWHSEALTAAVVNLMTGTSGRDSDNPGHRGRWWIVRGSRDDFPLQRVPMRVSMVQSTADPAAVPHRVATSRPANPASTSGMVGAFLAEAAAVPSGIWQEALVRGSERDFLQAALTGAAMERYDGAFISPLPADQPAAWRCFNYQTLRRCRGRVHANGVVVLRTSCDSGNIAAAIAVVKTFHEAVGSSWAMVQLGPQRQVDLLLVGPAEVAAWPQWRSGLQAVATEDYYRDWPAIAPISLALPGVRAASNLPIPATLEHWIQIHAVK